MQELRATTDCTTSNVYYSNILPINIVFLLQDTTHSMLELLFGHPKKLLRNAILSGHVTIVARRDHSPVPPSVYCHDSGISHETG